MKAKVKNNSILVNSSIVLITSILIIFTLSCSGDGSDEGPSILLPKNLQVTIKIAGATTENPEGDGTGKVSFKAVAENAVSFKLEFEGSQKTMNNGAYTIEFVIPGIQTYELKIYAMGTGGNSIVKSLQVIVNRKFDPPAELLSLLTDNDTQEWRIKSEVAGHMGVGPADATSPEYWIAQAFEKDYTGMYDDVYTFSKDHLFSHKTESSVYGKAEPLSTDLGSTGETVNDDDEYENYPLADYDASWEFGPVQGQETLFISDKGFLGFYVGGNHDYTILKRTDKDLILRTVGADGLGWFFILTTEEEAEIPADPEYTNLVWEDNFDVNGTPDASKWNYDIGTGDNGWGNNESQYYTDRTENVTAEDGVLRIKAKKENYQGSNFTSSRIKTQGKFDFKYGRVDVRAKLPSGGGTWPAIWMLGSNITSAGWPACGEIDIMEYTGNNPGKIQSAIHNTSSSGNTVNKKAIAIENENDEFHLYSMIWSENQISFLLDGERFYTYNPVIKDGGNWPFDATQFLILNVAMGGTMGGNIDTDFTESEMVIDYVRIYQ